MSCHPVSSSLDQAPVKRITDLRGDLKKSTSEGCCRYPASAAVDVFETRNVCCTVYRCRNLAFDVFYQSFVFLAVLQFVGGVAWGFYELAMSPVFIERIPQHLRPRILARFGLLNGFAMVGGSLVGGMILQLSGNSVMGFMTIFTLSLVSNPSNRIFIVPRTGKWWPKGLPENDHEQL